MQKMATSRFFKQFSFIFFLFMVLFSSVSFGYDERFVLNATDNGEYLLEIKLKEGHKIFWLNPGDSGDATRIDLSGSRNLSSYRVWWPYPKKDLYDEKITNYIYENDVIIPLVLSPSDLKRDVGLRVDLSYIICGDQCAPVKQTIERNLMLSGKIPYHNKMNIVRSYYDSGMLYLKVKLLSAVTQDPEFIITTQDKVFSSMSMVMPEDDDYVVVMQIAESEYQDLAGKDAAIYSNVTPEGLEIKLPLLSYSSNVSSTPLYLILLMALVGGFILNFMPCVLPVLALKLMAATKLTTNYRKSFIATICGILCSFWALSIVTIVMKNLGHSLGIGMGFQQVEFIIFLAVLIVIFISIALGRVSLTLPSFVQNIASLKFSILYFEDFMGGVIATLLSVPCTAPFLGTAMAFASFGGDITNFIIFTFVAIGFSLPYFLLIISPRLILMLPKSGPWMERLKQILAIALIASLVWLLSVLEPQLGMRATFGLVLILMLIKYIVEESDGFFKSSFWKIIALIALVMGSLYLPQMARREDNAHAKYLQSLWQELSPEMINQYVSENKVVIVDITADWCITCKYNKLLVWDRRSAVGLLTDASIVAMRGDMTVPNEQIEKYLAGNNKYGIPFNIVYGPGAPRGIVLPVLLSFDDLKAAVEKAK
jgi:suppressor for copper-sensitivity B